MNLRVITKKTQKKNQNDNYLLNIIKYNIRYKVEIWFVKMRNYTEYNNCTF